MILAMVFLMAQTPGPVGRPHVRPHPAPQSESPERPGARPHDRPHAAPPRQHRDLTPEERERLRHRLEEFKKLSPEERERIRRHFQEFRNLPPEAREELRRRFQALEEERRSIWEHLPPERRAELEKLPPERRRRVIEEAVRKRLTEQSGRLRQVLPPDVVEELEGLPLPERIRRTRELVENHRREQIRGHLEKTIEQGLLGPLAREWFADTPLPEAMQVLSRLEKWQVLRLARKNGLFDRAGLDEGERKRLEALPPEQFFRVLGSLRRGTPKEEAFRLHPPDSDRRFPARPERD
ncbi:MAG: DUF3106 domain-containing protein [Planctomycetota bacterium]